MSALFIIYMIVINVLAFFGIILLWFGWKAGAFSAMKDAWNSSGDQDPQ